MTTRLYGRFNERSEATGVIPELSPAISGLPELSTDGALPDIGESDTFGRVTGRAGIRRNRPRELASLSLIQSYDYEEQVNDNDATREPFSDLGLDLRLYPSSYFGFRFNNNFDVEEQDFSSWGLSSHIRDDRGDVFRVRYTYVENSLSQLEGNLELRLTDRLKLGYYTRYDDEVSDFIENQGALRVESDCGCWHFDIAFVDRINPDREQVLFSFTFKGLGDITQKLGFDDIVDRNSNTAAN